MAPLTTLVDWDMTSQTCPPPLILGGEWRFDEEGAVGEPGAYVALDMAPHGRLEIECTILPEPDKLDVTSGLSARIDTYAFGLPATAGMPATIRKNYARFVTQNLGPGLAPGRWQKARFTYAPEGLALEVDGQTVIQGTLADLLVATSEAAVLATPGIRYKRIVIRGEPVSEAERGRRKPRDRFMIGMTIDFPDDFLFADRPWEEEDFRALPARWQEMGIDRFYWIYNGGKAFGKWREFEYLFWGRRTGGADALFERVPDPLGVLVEEAHKLGMQAYAIVKPFDLGNDLRSFPDDPAQLPDERKRPWRCGGYGLGIAPFLMEHPHLFMQRHPYGTDPTVREKPIRRIKLYSRTDAPFPFSPQEIEFLVSDDNKTYRPYAGPIRIAEAVEERPEVDYHWAGNRQGDATTRVRSLTLDGLNVTQRYCALRVKGEGGAPYLVNRLCAIAEVFTDGEEPLPFTLGVQARRALKSEGEDYRWAAGTLEENGANFELYFGIPSFHRDGHTMDMWHAVFAHQNFLAFCKGKSPQIYAPCYAHDEALQFLLRFIGSCMDTGVDGIDLRLNSHNSTFEPQAYGFNAPVVEEFKRRHGVDVLTEDFDWYAWQELHGEYLTHVVREATGLIHSRGAKAQAHLGMYCTVGDRVNGYLNRTHDWKTWLREGMLDELTHKDDSLNSPHCREARDLSDELGLPFYECRRHWAGRPGETWPEIEGRAARNASAYGMDGVIFYENYAAVGLGERPGETRIVDPGVLDVIRELKR